MKKIFLIVFSLAIFSLEAKIHIFRVWSGYFQFYKENSDEINLGDTLQWRPLDEPMMPHTITSTEIPNGSLSFDYTWQMPVDTFFQYIPLQTGLYKYECTPHAISYNMVGEFEVFGNAIGIHEYLIDKNTIFPNPCSTSILIPFSIEKKYEILDENGRIVKEGTNVGILNIEELKNGIYYLRLEDEIQTFIKQD